ncbi:ArsC family reductase [Marinomonas pollencensis]|uniref:Spx/MgsR family transcriptional regulator n=1 Tax=Marinomonas pollencensis TaxID=491954 RepID=A0A3E0DU28_9GAMM|nr:ArsC family reductase [Marinomonas pollencensis]REG86896.1 Spx/MgsR family transcriptional regulator [Marinomonas pollencensis]
MISIYGIKNCDTMKKAFRWLDEHNIEYQFFDYKKVGVDSKLAKQWLAQQDWQQIINKRGTTWRKLDDETKDAMDNANALEIMQAQPSIIKRPLIIKDSEIILGFNAEEYQRQFLN